MPSQPFLSLPSLQGFLKQEGIKDVSIRDLNIEVMDSLLSSKKVEETYVRLEEMLGRGERPSLRSRTTAEDGPFAPTGHGKKSSDNGPNNTEEIERISWAKEVIECENMSKKVDWAKATLRSERFYNLDDYIESWKTIDMWLQAYGMLYYPSEITITDNSMKYSVYSSADIINAAHDVTENPYHDLFKGQIIDSIISKAPTILGISATATSQVIPAFTLARMLKDANSDIHITMGGSIFTKLIDNLKDSPGLFELIDSFIVFEGEHALLELANQLEGKRDFSKVPNFVYRDGDQTRINEPFHIEDINSLPTPDYDGFPLDLYLAPERVLPLQGSRGCYWRKCTFCNLHVDNLRFRMRSAELVLEDITKLTEKYKTKNLFFSDECMPVNQLDNLSTRIIDESIDIKWMAGIRFDKGLTKDILQKARDAGCLKMVFGLESSNKRILSLMDKGIETDIVSNIINYCADSGIAIHMYVIVGFPSETREEALETLDFIRSNDTFLNSRGASCLACLFELEKHAPILRDPGKYKLTSIAHPKHDDLSLGYVYETNAGMTHDEANEVYGYIRGEIDSRLNIFPYNFSMSDGLLYLDHLSEAVHELVN